MRNTNRKFILLLLFAAVSIVVGGCINTQALPSYARPGDLVSVGLGGIKRNTDGTTAWIAAQITAEIYYPSGPDAGLRVPVAVAQTFRAYPDHTSQYAVNSLDRSNPQNNFKELDPYDGQWWVTLQLVTPGTATPAPLPAGSARIELTVPGMTDNSWAYEGQLKNFPIEILSGTRDVSQNEVYQYAAYQHEETLMVMPSGNLNGLAIGGLQVKVDYDPTALTSGTALLPRLVPVSHDPNINIIQYIDTTDTGDGRHHLIAMVTNPNGFVELDGGSWAIGKSTHKDLWFAVTVDDASELGTGWESNYAIDFGESFYIDNDGNVIGALSPALTRSF